MKKRWVAVLLTGLILTELLTGCAGEKAKPQQEKTYVKWMKVADGEYHPFRMPEYMNTKGLFLQRMGPEKPEEIYFADVGASRVELISSGFDLNAEIDKAVAQLREKERDVSGLTTQYLPKRNALLLQCNSPELWMYHIEDGSLELLGDGSYTGVPYEAIYKSAYEKWGEESYVYPYDSVEPSPNEQYLAFGSTLASVDGDTGDEVYLYDMNEKKERLLLTGQSKAENYNVKGWVSNQWLLCTKQMYRMTDGVSQGVESREAFLVNPGGERVPLNLPDADSPESYRYLHAENGMVVTACGKSDVHIMGLKIEEDGTADVAFDYTAADGRLVNDVKVNSRRTRAAFLNAPHNEAPGRQLCVVGMIPKQEEQASAGADKTGQQAGQTDQAGQNGQSGQTDQAGQNRQSGQTDQAGQQSELMRVIGAPKIGDSVETDIKDFYWIDSSRLLVLLTETWEGQETVSTWVLDLRAKSPDAESAAGSGQESQNSGGNAAPALETDTVRQEDQAGKRDASTMADAYMTAMDVVASEKPEMNGGQGELKYIALDTADMLWLTSKEKEALFAQMAKKWDAEILDKTYTELKEEGYLNQDGYFADGMLFKITGAPLLGNEMKLDVFKWRSEAECVKREGLVLRFFKDGWKVAS